jgi:hypothetical protein
MVLGVSVDEDVEKLQEFVRNNISYPVLTNAGGVANQYNVSVIAFQETGFRGEASLNSHSAQLLN